MEGNAGRHGFGVIRWQLDRWHLICQSYYVVLMSKLADGAMTAGNVLWRGYEAPA